MKASALVKSGLIGVLGLCSWTLTSILIHRPTGQARAQSQTQESPRPYVISRVVDNPGEVAEPFPGDVPAIFKFVTEEMFEVAPAQEFIWAHTAVAITDSRGPRKFMWSLDVQDTATEQEVFRNLYEEDVLLSAENGEKLHSKFDKLVPLPPGSYRVGIRIYSMPRDFDVRLLQDKGTEESLKHLESYCDITL